MTHQNRFALGDFVALAEATLARAEGAFLDFLFDDAPSKKKHDLSGSVAVVRVDGPLAQRASWFEGYDAIRSRFEGALADTAADKVLLRINSPGGDIAGLFAAVEAMRAAKRRAGKPVEAVADEQASSAAYALATVADRIWVPRSGAVGSIGVLSLLTDLTGMQDAGKRVLLRSGKRKAETHPYAGLTEEALARRQARIDELARQFAELVAQARGGDAAKWLALEGEELLGEAAVRAGLADAVGTFDEVLRKMKEKSTLAARAKAVGLSEGASEEEIAAAEQAADAKKKLDAAARRAAEELAEEARAEAEAKAQAAEQANATINAMVASGRLPPAKREKAFLLYTQHGPQALAALGDILGGVPSALAGEHTPGRGPGGAPAGGGLPVTLTGAERAVCKQLGLDVQEFAKAKAAERAAEEE